jgi:hypothetical protein
MELPVKYTTLSPRQKRLVRLEYIKLQNGKCYHCGESLGGKPSTEVMEKYIEKSLFPPNFFTHPIHLHHNHETGMTIGVVHARCNAVLWQYFGE